ncbi:unnamed protein product [Musa acuminata subsp. malaccensis]|uniref:(wild Malaysian banana) hypothetical protein n=1 Tax=Musa acuminata subsp. malaccensis TaxID=214687 RepID=A0A804IZ44_MUSAM|nr:PREDICTED: uncharacterized protein LOC103983291 [Musa acuminata subsp. malaccensis]CAG1844805.1 unnamed protein product [Musa acuminata subsp. malaccensis]
MAKGRRHGAERLLEAPAHSAGRSGAADLPNLAEDDIWAAFEGDNDEGGGQDRRTSRARSRVWVDGHVGGLSLNFEDSYHGTAAVAARSLPLDRLRVAASAPVNVPAWSRSLRSSSGVPPPEEEAEEEEEEETGGEWLPPHEYLARVQGKTMGTSVLEGAGRTLKGRDMSRVRDAVWSQTGYFG